jgi:antitoxin component YwqK of YwqJK toxin-antitoxin module
MKKCTQSHFKILRRNTPIPLSRVVGNWKFYDGRGRLLGEENLDNGNGHFSVWSNDGTKACEGEVKNGLKDGTWTFYGLGQRPLGTKTFENGLGH